MGWLCGPGSSSADLAAPQQASAWVLCRDDGFTEGQGQLPVPPGLGQPNKSQPLLANCLPPAKESNQVSGVFFQPKGLFFFLTLFGFSSWELVHPCTSCADPCNLCTALGTWLPTLTLHVPALQPVHLQTKPQGKVCSHVNELSCLSNDFMLWFG